MAHRSAAADLSVPGREVIQSRVDIGPEAPVKHTHPGEEIIYILEGSLEYQIEGQPPRTFNADEALTVPAGAVHAVRNAGSGNAAGTRHLCRGDAALTPDDLLYGWFLMLRRGKRRVVASR